MMRLAPALALCILPACAEVSYTRHSRPRDAEFQSTGGPFPMSTHASALVSLDEVDLEITPHNSFVPFSMIGPVIPLIPLLFRTTCDATFTLEIRVHAKTAGLSFDPYDLVLVSGRESFAPSVCGRPTRARHSSVPATICRLAYDVVPTTDAALTVSGDMSVIVCFPCRTPDPGERFDLTVNGVVAAGRPVVVPALTFEEETGWRYQIQILSRARKGGGGIFGQTPGARGVCG